MLRDGATIVHVMDIDNMDVTISNYRIILINILYVPDLKEILFSIKQHIHHPNFFCV